MRHAAQILFGMLVFAAALLAVAAEDESENPEFVGQSKCKICHAKPKLGGAEFLKWEKGPHAKAYESLKSEEAKKIAAEAGVADPVTAEQCVKCHVTSFKHEALWEEGIGCETCHGPGSIYRKKSIMEDYDASIKAGMRPIKVFHPDTGELDADKTAENAEKLCRECHGIEHKDVFPAAREFNFEESWKKILHDEATLKAEFPEAFK